MIRYKRPIEGLISYTFYLGVFASDKSGSLSGIYTAYGGCFLAVIARIRSDSDYIFFIVAPADDNIVKYIGAVFAQFVRQFDES